MGCVQVFPLVRGFFGFAQNSFADVGCTGRGLRQLGTHALPSCLALAGGSCTSQLSCVSGFRLASRRMPECESFSLGGTVGGLGQGVPSVRGATYGCPRSVGKKLDLV